MVLDQVVFLMLQDASQFAELSVLGERTCLKARKMGVQSIMIEGPGHISINQIEANVIIAKRLGYDVPLYFLGPLITDIAPGLWNPYNSCNWKRISDHLWG
jgi:thiamine biosynthesis protein ThiC